MTPGRARALAAAHAAAFAPEARGWSAEEIAALAAAPGAILVSDPPSGALRGFALARVAGDEAELLTIAVSPAARGLGLGGALLVAVETRAAAAGARRLFLEVAESNRPARALYQRAGYAAVGRRPRYYGAIDALVLIKDLRGSGSSDGL